MEISQKKDGSKLEITLKGRLDTSTAPQLSDTLKLIGIQELVFDLKDVDYVSSAGLRILLSAHKQIKANGGTMTVLNVCDSVMEVFELVGFKELLNFK